jgi:hypothetical protein
MNMLPERALALGELCNWDALDQVLHARFNVQTSRRSRMSQS